MRFKIIFPLSDSPGDDLVALADTRIDRAIGFAKRLAEGDWWEILDTHTGNIVASSESERAE